MFVKAPHGGPHLATCPLCGQTVSWVMMNMTAIDERKGRSYNIRRKWLTDAHYILTSKGEVKCAGYEKDSAPSLRQ